MNGTRYGRRAAAGHMIEGHGFERSPLGARDDVFLPAVAGLPTLGRAC
jgi:hypothetical protein